MGVRAHAGLYWGFLFSPLRFPCKRLRCYLAIPQTPETTSVSGSFGIWFCGMMSAHYRIHYTAPKSIYIEVLTEKENYEIQRRSIALCDGIG